MFHGETPKKKQTKCCILRRTQRGKGQQHSPHLGRVTTTRFIHPLPQISHLHLQSEQYLLDLGEGSWNFRIISLWLQLLRSVVLTTKHPHCVGFVGVVGCEKSGVSVANRYPSYMSWVSMNYLHYCCCCHSSFILLQYCNISMNCSQPSSSSLTVAKLCRIISFYFFYNHSNRFDWDERVGGGTEMKWLMPIFWNLWWQGCGVDDVCGSCF